MHDKNTVYLTEDQYCILLSMIRRAADELYDLIRSPFVDSGEVRSLRLQFHSYAQIVRVFESLSRSRVYRLSGVPDQWRA